MSHKNHHKDKTAKAVAFGGVIAAAAGFVAGVLTAPKSGKETRTELKKAADRSVAQAERELKKLHTELDTTIEDTKNNGSKLSAKAKKELDDLLDRAKDSKEKAREVLSAVHEGETDDRDLKKAIADANAAIDHLREFVKKK